MYRILVVDDEAKIRLLIRKYAEFEGHEVTEAENGMEAVRLFRRTPDAFDIVIMDVMMPELDGFSAVAEIKKIASPAVIMLSARGEEYDKIHGFELGVDDYVVKPFSPKELMMRVAAVMSRVQRTAIPKHELFRAEGLDNRFYRTDRHGRRRACRFVPEGIRPAVLHGQQPQHRPHTRNAYHKCLGV